MQAGSRRIGRRGALALTVSAFMVALTCRQTWADTEAGATLLAPVRALDNALVVVMKSGAAASFDQRYRVLEPVIDRVFNLDAVLAELVGLAWSGIPVAQKAKLAIAFRHYIVSSYIANFDSYNGQKFEILPDVRMLGNNEAVVRTRLMRRGKAAVKLDYVMRSGPAGWQVVDVLTDGTISRVAVQRSDFRRLLESGGVPALTAGLERKVGSLSGSMHG